MKEPHVRGFLVVSIIVGFYGFVVLVLMGLVDVQSPEVAKLVGALFGYLSGLLTPVMARYFREHPSSPSDHRPLE